MMNKCPRIAQPGSLSLPVPGSLSLPVPSSLSLPVPSSLSLWERVRVRVKVCPSPRIRAKNVDRRNTCSRLVYLAVVLAAAVAVAGCVGPRALGPKELTEFRPLEFRPPAIEVATLSNDMTVLLLEDHELPVVDAAVRIRTGSIYEPADKVGLAALTGTVMRTGGTASLTGDELDEELEFMAASITTSIGLDSGVATLSVLKKDVRRGFELFADVLRHPAFREEKPELARRQALEAIRRRYDDPVSIASIEFSKLVYGPDTVWGRVSTIETVNAVTRDDLVAFHHRYYAPNNMMMAVSGDFDRTELIVLLEEVFAGWEPREIELPAIPPLEVRYEPQVYWVQREGPQTAIAMGHLGMRRHAPEQYAVETMNYVYGLGGFVSRLMREVRSNRGLAYGVQGYVGPGMDRGLFRVFCQTKTESTIEATALIQQLTRELTERPVPADELGSIKDYLINRFVFKFESAAALVQERLLRDYLGYPPDYLETYTERIRAVTADEILDAARKYVHPDGMTYVFVGDRAHFDGDLTQFGPVHELVLDRDSGTSTIR